MEISKRVFDKGLEVIKVFFNLKVRNLVRQVSQFLFRRYMSRRMKVSQQISSF